MTAAKHTPGPWHRNIPPATKYVVVWSGRNTHVAKLCDDSRVSDEEAEANINLIAAAPDLLEALLYYRDQCSGAEPSISVFHQMLDDAIARATGSAS